MASAEPSTVGASTGGWAGALLWTAVLVAQGVLLFCAWACIGILQAWSATSLISTWSWAYQDPEKHIWEKFRQLLDIKYGLVPGQSLLYGWDNLNLIFYFFCPVVGIFTYSLYTMLPSNSPMHRAVRQELSALWAPLHRVLTWQLPFRRFWQSWCGGLNLAEALLWSVWVVVHVVGFWDLVGWYGSSSMAGWDAVGMSYYVPKSVLRLEYISVAMAWAIYIDTAILFFPVAHNSFLNRMLGIPYGALVRFHRWIGHFVLWTTLGHGVFYYAFWIADPTINFWKYFFDWGVVYGIVSFAGTIALGFGLLLWFTSFAWVRRNYYKVFYYSHIIGFLGFLVFTFIHYYWSWFGLYPSLLLLGADFVVRSYYAAKGAHISGIKRSKDGRLVELTITLEPGTFKEPARLSGAHIFLKVPAVSRLDYHPFSVVSSWADPATKATHMTVVIKKYSRWTADLMDVLASSSQALPVHIWRPFDEMHPAEHWEQYGGIVAVAGGVAVTPVVAMILDIMSWRSANGHNAEEATTAHKVGDKPRRTPRVLLLFAARNEAEFSCLDERILQEAAHGDGWLEVRLFQTGQASAAAHDGGKSSLAPPAIETKGSSGSSSGDLPPPPHFPPLGGVEGSDGSSQPSTTFGKASNIAWSCIKWMVPADFLTDAQYVWVVLLAYLGGFMGIVMAQAASVEILADNNYFHDGYWRVGLITVAVISVQGLGLPAFFVLGPAYATRLYKRWKGVRFTPQYKGQSDFPVQAAGGRVVCAESGASLSVRRGRPDVAAELSAYVDAVRSTGSRTAVISGGPEPLMQQVALAVAALNDQLGAPAAVLHQVAHEL